LLDIADCEHDRFEYELLFKVFSLPIDDDGLRLNRPGLLCGSSELESSSSDMLSLFVVTDDIADDDGLTLDDAVNRDGKARKNHAPDFFHN
jgi:hypothetical protein